MSPRGSRLVNQNSEKPSVESEASICILGRLTYHLSLTPLLCLNTYLNTTFLSCHVTEADQSSQRKKGRQWHTLGKEASSSSSFRGCGSPTRERCSRGYSLPSFQRRKRSRYSDERTKAMTCSSSICLNTSILVSSPTGTRYMQGFLNTCMCCRTFTSTRQPVFATNS